MHKAPVERRTHFVAKRTVLVCLPSRVETRMKVECGFRGVLDANRLRQKAIHRAPEILDRDRIFHTHRGYLRQSVYSRIRPPGPRYLHRTPFDRADYFFEHALNRRQTGLHLPAVKSGSIIGDLKSQSPHKKLSRDQRERLPLSS